MFIVECFQAKGASIGDIFVVSECAFHDRRIPIPVSVIPLGSSWLFCLLHSSLLDLKCSWLWQVYIEDCNEWNNLLVVVVFSYYVCDRGEVGKRVRKYILSLVLAFVLSYVGYFVLLFDMHLFFPSSNIILPRKRIIMISASYTSSCVIVSFDNQEKQE